MGLTVLAFAHLCNTCLCIFLLPKVTKMGRSNILNGNLYCFFVFLFFDTSTKYAISKRRVTKSMITKLNLQFFIITSLYN